MTEMIALLHHVLSVTLAIICWWLAHQNARSTPPGRVIAAGFSVSGFLLLVVAFARASGDDLNLAVIAVKASLIVTFLAVSYRRHKLKGET